jgi:hypothetical protein
MTHARAWQKRQRAELRCMKCGGWAGPAVISFCDACNEKHKAMCRASAKRRRDARIAAGLCERCDTPALPGLRCCLDHKIRHRESVDRSAQRERVSRHAIRAADGRFQEAAQ